MKIYQIYFNSLWEGTFNTLKEAIHLVHKLSFYCSACEPITIVEFIE